MTQKKGESFEDFIAKLGIDETGQFWPAGAIDDTYTHDEMVAWLDSADAHAKRTALTPLVSEPVLVDDTTHSVYAFAACDEFTRRRDGTAAISLLLWVQGRLPKARVLVV